MPAKSGSAGTEACGYCRSGVCSADDIPQPAYGAPYLTIALEDLPESERFVQLCPEIKHFIDTLKMIAYRAESALAGEVRETLARSDDARALLKRLFVTPANLRPDYQQSGRC